MLGKLKSVKQYIGRGVFYFGPEDTPNTQVFKSKVKSVKLIYSDQGGLITEVELETGGWQRREDVYMSKREALDKKKGIAVENLKKRLTKAIQAYENHQSKATNSLRQIEDLKLRISKLT